MRQSADGEEQGESRSRSYGGSARHDALEKTIGLEIESLGHEYALPTRTIAQTIDAELVEERVIAMLSGFVAALALLLPSIGL